MFKFKVENIKPIEIDIQNDDTTLNPRQHLLLQQKYHVVDMLFQANTNLDNKALSLLQSSGLIILLTGVLTVPDILFDEPTNRLSLIMLSIAFITFLGMIGLSIRAFTPISKQLPGSLENWDEIYNQYILVDNEVCFNQVLSDTIRAANSLLTVNRYKSRSVILAAWLLFFQVLGLLIIALLTPFLTI